MSMLIRVPKNRDEECTLYANGNAVWSFYDSYYGTLLKLEGTAVVFYYYSSWRRAYVVTENDENGRHSLRRIALPLVKESPYLVSFLRGRQIDLMKLVLYGLEKKFGKSIYAFEADYWLRICGLVAGFANKRRGGAGLRRRAEMFTERYFERFEGKSNEN